MAKAIWNGSVQFGLVNIPVKMTTAVSSRDPRFHQINKKTGNRVQQKRVDAATGEEVPYEDIVKGTEIAKDNYVTITEEELSALDPIGSKTIEIDTFVDPGELDPVMFEKAYYLEPEKVEGAKPYALLLEAMRETGKVAVGTFVMRSKQYVSCVWPRGNGLAISTLHWHDELRDAPGVDTSDLDEKQLAMAKQLVESLAENFDASKYHDTYRERVNDLIEAKAEGKALPAPKQNPSVAMPDLMAALDASIAATKKAREEKIKAAAGQ